MTYNRAVNDSYTDWDAALEDLQPDIGPFTDGLQVDAAVDECLREVAPPSAKGVCADSNGSRYLISFEELDGLRTIRSTVGRSRMIS